MKPSALHIEILPEAQRKLLDLLAAQPWIAPFYLAGGTALALHIGHRQSVDFDFLLLFTHVDVDVHQPEEAVFA